MILLSIGVVLLGLGLMRAAYLLGHTRTVLKRVTETNVVVSEVLLQQEARVIMLEKHLEAAEKRLETIEGKRWLDMDGNVRRAL